jgi:hypothetical protein
VANIISGVAAHLWLKGAVATTQLDSQRTFAET